MNTVTAWALDVAQRTVKTFAQTLVGMLGAGALSILHVAWQTDLDVAAFAALVCVLQNVSSFPTPRVVPSPAPTVVATPEPQPRYANGDLIPTPVPAVAHDGGIIPPVVAADTPPAPPSAG